MDPVEDAKFSPKRELLRPTSDKRRTLRTYSKRLRLTEDESGSGPLMKKRKVDKEPATRTPDLPRLPPAQPAPPSGNIPKSSILSYFKPCRSSSATESSDLLSESDKLINTPPSPPPVSRKTKEPRRLRLRPSTPIYPSSDTTEDSTDHNEEYRDIDRPGLRKGLRSRTRSTRERWDTANVDGLGDEEEPKSSPVPKKPQVRSKPVATVQTTINLSSKPTFMECKTCRIVYNPLHPADVKYHSQRHAVFLRGRAKA
ncbi:hypothetical protein ColKHC_08999 [Colletotrichum higginsianum]|nr:hypothetical protein ColKHC_08999 [Colletotrichum higginsianum]